MCQIRIYYSEVYRYIGDDIDSMHENVSMSNDTLNNVMLTSVNGPDIAEFDAARAVDNWVSPGKRRLEGEHSTQQQKKQNISNEM